MVDKPNRGLHELDEAQEKVVAKLVLTKSDEVPAECVGLVKYLMMLKESLLENTIVCFKKALAEWDANEDFQGTLRGMAKEDQCAQGWMSEITHSAQSVKPCLPVLQPAKALMRHWEAVPDKLHNTDELLLTDAIPLAVWWPILALGHRAEVDILKPFGGTDVTESPVNEQDQSLEPAPPSIAKNRITGCITCCGKIQKAQDEAGKLKPQTALFKCRTVDKAVDHALAACCQYGRRMVEWCHTALEAEVSKVEALADSRQFEQAVAYASEKIVRDRAQVLIKMANEMSDDVLAVS